MSERTKPMRRLLVFALVIALPFAALADLAHAQEPSWPEGYDALSVAWRKAFAQCVSDGFTPIGVAADTSSVMCATRNTEVPGRVFSRMTVLKQLTVFTGKAVPPGFSIELLVDVLCAREMVIRRLEVQRNSGNLVSQYQLSDTVFVTPGSFLNHVYLFACRAAPPK